MSAIIRPTIEADHRYLVASWAEGYKDAPGNREMPWRTYRKHVVPELEDVLLRDDTEVIVAAAPGGDIVGWIALSRLWPSVTTVHWVHTRYRAREGGEQLRRRGVMRDLVSAAALRRAVVHTHLGAPPKSRADGRERSDVVVARWLRGLGREVTHVPYEEWVR